MHLIFLFLIFVVAACNKPGAHRVYTEKVILSSGSMQAGLNFSAADSSFMQNWSAQLPAHWKGHRESGTRIQSVSYISQNKLLEGTLTFFPGSSGTLEQNLRRWLGQMGIQSVSDGSLLDFQNTPTQFQLKNGLVAYVYNFNKYLNKPFLIEKSLLVAMLQVPEGQFYFKLEGNPALLQSQEQAFIQWVTSLHNLSQPHPGFTSVQAKSSHQNLPN